MIAQKMIKSLFMKLGYDIVRYAPSSHPLARRKRLLESYEINVLLDVGANTGQYGKQLREIGYKGKIISFEPLSDAYKKLVKNAKDDRSWETFNYALGESEGKVDINVAENSYSSSILEMLPCHVKFEPESQYIGKEEIEITALDLIFYSLCSPEDKLFLKIDTQGFENKVIKGAEQSLRFIDTVQLEMSLIPLYKGELLFNEMCSLLHEKEYRLVSIESGFSDSETGQLLQCDGIFHRF